MKIQKFFPGAVVASVLAASAFGASSEMSHAWGESLKLGLQGGVNFESAETPAQVSSRSRTGWTVGVVGDFPLAENFSIAPELNYSRRSFDILNSGNLAVTAYSHSLEIPVLAKVGFGETVRPYVFAGPMGIWNFSNEVRAVSGATTTSTSYDPRTFDFAVTGGVGIAAGAFFVNARYVYGVLDVDKTTATYRSRGIKVLAGMQL